MSLPELVHERALALFKSLLRIDTTNPPGNERAAAECLADFLAEGGLDPKLIESAPFRGNVVARLQGTGAAPPLLLAAHLDVVPSEDGPWTRPPFAAGEHQGWLYGRGTVDMKNMAAMSAALVRHFKESGARLSRDVIFAGVADEETGCDKGAGFLVDHHADRVRAEYAIGEVGGFSMHVMGRTFYPVQVAEKGIAWLKATATGEAGHGSIPRADSAVIRLAETIARIGHTRLPQHEVEVVRMYLRAIGENIPAPGKWILPQLTNPALSGVILDRLLPDKSLARTLATSLANTASPTVLRAGTKTNVIPSEASVEIDGRTLPGQTAHDLVRELEAISSEHVRYEILREAPAVETSPHTPVFRMLSDAIRRADPSGIPIPYLLPGFTDAKAFHRLGTRWYGFAPVQLPKDAGIRFADLYHRPNERIPVAGFRWGLEVLHDALARICGT